ncbi:MAG: YcgN family cysteine cluster protein [Hyphomicrobium sp.]
MGRVKAPFWKTKTLEEMSRAEWESLCDGCARCCLIKLEDEDNGDIHLTRLSCRMLKVSTCRCSNYAERFKLMHDCVEITPEKTRSVRWLPKTCGYRVVSEGRDLAWWHPLISGSPDTVHEAGISVRSFAMTEARVKVENYERYIIDDFAD